jgi:predicted ATP-grasp superfamily ATP-dependent carboligase
VLKGTSDRKTVLITGARAPVAVHIARLLSEAGYRVVMCDHLKNPLGSASKIIDKYLCLPSFRLDRQTAADTLQQLILQENINYVVPTCEEVFYLAEFWAQEQPSAALIAPAIAMLEAVHNKFRFIEMLEGMGLAAPKTYLLESRADIDRFRQTAGNYVFKPVWSRFASHTQIRPTQASLERVTPSPQAPWVAQTFVSGKEVSVYALAWNGKLTGISVYRNAVRAGLGAGVCFEPVENAVVRSFVQTFVHETNWTGQISFDVVLTSDGSVMPLECNPRATSGVHFFEDPKVFANALLFGNQEASPSGKTPQGVRLAIWIYGLSGLYRQHSFRSFWRALMTAQDVLNVPSDPIGLAAQMKSIWEFLKIARRTGRSLQQASSYDLEWNGPDQSSISN